VATSTRWDEYDSAEIVEVDDRLATSPARTAIALAAERSLESGVAAFDHVARVHGVDLAALRNQVAAHLPFRGGRKAEAALRIATGAAESALESLSLVRIHQLGFPRPRQQVEFVVEGVRYRTDFFWPEFGVIGEADGRSKFAADPVETMWLEKRREDALRMASAGFARWGWDDAWLGRPLAVRLERAGLTADPRNASKYAFRMQGEDAKRGSDE
jgi:hypothetical protein